ncbi:MAG: eL32 family ribosomal protein [Candidatus Woesearchaeota archaeon]
MEKLLKIRYALKSKKPSFVRHDSHKKKRVSPSWRRPKGRQNKVRLNKRGYVRHISTGFGSPAAVKGLSRDGLRQCVVTTKKDYEYLDPKTDGVIISSRVGDRKREELISYAVDKRFTVLNLDPETFNKRLKEKLDRKSSKRKDVLKRRAKKASKEKEKKAEKKSSESKSEEEPSSSEKPASEIKTVDASDKQADEKDKQEQKKEYDKFLTKGDQK